MKPKLMIFAIGVLLLEINCSNQIRVRSDYDRDVNLAAYKAYAWLPYKEIESKNNPLLYNELTDKRIRKAVELQFQAKGIPFDEENPDFRVHHHIIVENRSSVSPAHMATITVLIGCAVKCMFINIKKAHLSSI